MRAAVFEGPGELSVDDIPDPVAAPDGIVIAVDACGICGSDLKTYRSGRLARPGQVLGHEFVGRIVEVGSDVRDLAIGELVTALPYVPCTECARCASGRTSLCETAFRSSIANGLPGGFAEYLHLPGARRDETVFALPDDLAPGSGALVEPLAVGVHAVELAMVEPDSVVVVLGLGTVGQAVVLALRAAGVRHVIATDLSPKRCEAARSAGATVVTGSTDDIIAAVSAITGRGAYGAPAACDAIIDCAGVAPLITGVMPALRGGGSLVLAALHDQPFPVDATSIVRRGVRVVGTFGYDDDFRRAAALVASGDVSADDLVTHRFGLEHITEAFEAQADAGSSVKVLVQPGGTS
ncbi:MAG: alcohol dehydrogenase catalytic domain-containing protein [Ilumatobacteraceae bacterium]|nr:alcohol dehydrogenase catalytic domain-containing protein [Ilumatobacteraceae bacterium]